MPLFRSFEKFCKSDKPVRFALLWGILEGTVFFVVPDVLTCFVGLFNRKKALLSSISTIIGSIFGGAIMYGLTVLNGTNMNAMLEKIPGISSKMITSTSSQLQNGLISLLTAPLQGIPYKVYAVQAALQNFSLADFLLWTIPARFERILPVTLLAMLVGYSFRKSIRKRTSLWIAAYASIWIAFYIFYFLRISYSFS